MNRLDYLFSVSSLHDAVSDFLNRFLQKTTAKTKKMMNRIVQQKN